MKLNLICYGDSNTYGYDPTSYFGGRYDAGTRWTDVLAQKTGLEVVNQGMNGREIPTGSVSVPKDCHLFAVMLGTNDLLQGSSPKSVALEMERFLLSLPLPREQILLIAPVPMKRGAWVATDTLTEHSKALAPLYENLARKLGVHFVNAGNWDVELSFDGVHFTPEGHRAFAQGLKEAPIMKKLTALLLSLSLTGCSAGGAGYQQITQEQAKQIMDSEQVLVLDVREQYEYDEGHIPKAVLLPLGQISEETAAKAVPAKDTKVLVYCRSGNRSKQAAKKLAELGYANIFEFGGITTWPYEIEQ